MQATPLVQFDATLIQRSTDATIITANERLRRALIDVFADYARPTPRIYQLDEYLRVRFDAVPRADRSVLLSPLAQRLAWLQSAPIVDDIDPEQLYADVAAAWKLLHDWDLVRQLGQFDDNENHRLFGDWAQRYASAAESRGWVTACEITAIVANAIRQRTIDAEPLLLVGFDVVWPSLRHLLDAVQSASQTVELHRPDGRTPERIDLWSFADSAEELSAAIHWAAAAIGQGHPNTAVGIVVPDANVDHEAIVGRLDALLRPDTAYTAPGDGNFNISGGVTLADYPVIADALLLLDWLGAARPYQDIERLLRSAFFAFGVDPATASAPTLPDAYSAARWSRGRPPSPLGNIVSEARRIGLLRLDVAVARIRELLHVVSWPNRSRLTAEDHEAVAAFDAMLDELAMCAPFTEPGDLASMIGLILRTARRQLFAPSRPDASLHVLGALETIGLHFTHLWVTGLDDGRWPAPPRPNPFIPLRLQRAARIARSDFDGEAEFARRMTERWLGAAPTIVFSHARTRDDEARGPSPTISAIAATKWRPATGAANSAGHPFLQRATIDLVRRDEPDVGPVRRDRLRHRGSIILRDQSACPFRAFARNRLYVEPRRIPHRYPDSADRGTAIHAALRALFQHLGTEINEAVLDEAVVNGALTGAVDAATAGLGSLPPPFVESERARLHRLLGDWLEVERARAPLRIVAIERATTLSLGDFEFDLRVDRVDDASNEIVVVDYKTGEVVANAVFGERLEEPQLPMYALATPNATGIAVAAVRIGDCRLSGWSRTPLSSGPVRLRRPIESDDDWGAMMDLWRRRLLDLTDEFVAGVADVRPRDAKACRECDLHALCRIGEIERIAGD